jgi:hypothetical protein
MKALKVDKKHGVTSASKDNYSKEHGVTSL